MSLISAHGIFRGTRTPLRRSRTFIIGFVLFASLVLMTIRFIEPMSRFIGASTTRIPERYVELSLTQHQAVPKQVRAGEKASFNVSIHNRQGLRQDISYIAWVDINGQRELLQSGVLGLNDDQTTQVNIPFKLPQAGLRAQLIVELAGRPEAIHFWSQS